MVNSPSPKTNKEQQPKTRTIKAQVKQNKNHLIAICGEKVVLSVSLFQCHLMLFFLVLFTSSIIILFLFGLFDFLCFFIVKIIDCIQTQIIH